MMDVIRGPEMHVALEIEGRPTLCIRVRIGVGARYLFSRDVRSRVKVGLGAFWGS